MRECARIGIVGHRTNHTLRSEVRGDIESAFSLIENALPSGTDFTLISGLAEGADQFAVAVKPLGWSLEAILPFSRENYEGDFAAAADGSNRDMRPALREILQLSDRVTSIDSGRDDKLAYYRSGLFMTRTIDVLVAVWDGKAPNGPGGTGDIVRAAVEAKIPVIWVTSNGDFPLRLPVQRVEAWIYQTTDNIDVMRDRIKEAFETKQDLGRHLGTGHGKPDLSESAKAEVFHNEDWPVTKGIQVYSALARLLTPPHRRYDRSQAVTLSWKRLLDEMPRAAKLHDDIEKEVGPLYERADGLAMYYANTYRSAYVIAYLSAFLAVVLALMGLVIPHTYAITTQVHLKALLVGLELLTILVILGLVTIGTRNRWHQKWMEYRAAAEMLRHLCFLAFLGAHRRPDGDLRHGRNRPWTSILVDRVAKRIGLPDAVIDNEYLGKLISAVRDFEIEPQLDYHTTNARRLYTINHVLHGAGDWCFYVTAALLGCFLTVYGLDQALQLAGHDTVIHSDHDAPAGLVGVLYGSKVAVGFLAALLPALGAALSGIRFTGEFETLAGRSEIMTLALLDLRKGYTDLLKAPDFDRTASIVMETAATLSADIDDWKVLYTNKRLSLPA